MKKTTNTRVNVQLSTEEHRALGALRRLHDPIPTASKVMRQALMEKFARDVKDRRPKNNGSQEEVKRG